MALIFHVRPCFHRWSIRWGIWLIVLIGCLSAGGDAVSVPVTFTYAQEPDNFGGVLTGNLTFDSSALADGIVDDFEMDTFEMFIAGNLFVDDTIWDNNDIVLDNRFFIDTTGPDPVVTRHLVDIRDLVSQQYELLRVSDPSNYAIPGFENISDGIWMVQPAQQDFTWIGSADSQFLNPANYLLADRAPGAGDAITFDDQGLGPLEEGAIRVEITSLDSTADDLIINRTDGTAYRFVGIGGQLRPTRLVGDAGDLFADNLLMTTLLDTEPAFSIHLINNSSVELTGCDGDCQGQFDVEVASQLLFSTDDSGTTLGSNFSVDGVGNLTVSTGKVTIDGASIRVDRLVNSGELFANGTVTATSGLSNAGELHPGVSPGRFSITGSFDQGDTGTLHIEIGGTEAGTEYDQVSVLETAQLDGALTVSLVNDFVVVAGDMFTILTAGAGVMGAFDTFPFQIPLPDPNLSWNILYESNAVILAVEALQEHSTGDFNLDGVVDAADYTVWRDTLGQNVAPGSGADADGNGMVDGSDYDLWKSFYGSGRNKGSSNGAVPEPAAHLLWGLAATLLSLGTRQSRK